MACSQSHQYWTNPSPSRGPHGRFGILPARFLVETLGLAVIPARALPITDQGGQAVDVVGRNLEACQDHSGPLLEFFSGRNRVLARLGGKKRPQDKSKKPSNILTGENLHPTMGRR